MNSTVKRIFAIIGIVVLLGIYIATFIVGITGGENMKGWFTACILATVVVPSMMWAIQFIYKRLKSDVEESRKQ